METIRAMSERKGEPMFGFVIQVTGGLPHDQEKRHDVQRKMVAGFEAVLLGLEKEGVCIGSLILRAEEAGRYVELGLPNAQ